MFTPGKSSLPSLCNQKWLVAAKPQCWEHGWSQATAGCVSPCYHMVPDWLLPGVLRWTSWGTVFLLWVFPHCGGLTAKLCTTFATPWTVAHQSPLSMGFSRQEYWNGLPFPSPGDLPDPGIEPGSPALHGGRGGVLRPSSILIKRILILFEHGAYLGTVPNSQSGPDTGN